MSQGSERHSGYQADLSSEIFADSFLLVIGKEYYLDERIVEQIGPVRSYILEFRCYFCDEIKNEEPFFFEIAGQRKEPVCSRCHDKMEVVRRLKKGEESRK